jgi:hypothetical protein
MTWRRGWARLAARSLNAAGNPILADVETALSACGPVERERLVEAVQVYLASGSIGASAAELFCHRNTVANRLRRFCRTHRSRPDDPRRGGPPGRRLGVRVAGREATADDRA